MTKRTTMKRLKSYAQKVEAKEYRRTGWRSNPDDNPHDHPLPTLPSQEYLEGIYLKEIERSSPGLLSRALCLIGLVRQVRENEIPYSN